MSYPDGVNREAPREPVFAVPLAALLGRFVVLDGTHTEWRCGLIGGPRDAWRDVCKYDHTYREGPDAVLPVIIAHLAEVHGLHPLADDVAQWKAGFDTGWAARGNLLTHPRDAVS